MPVQRHVVLSVLLLLVLVTGAGVVYWTRSGPARTIKVDGSVMRERALSRELPPFPAESLKRGSQGVAVAGLLVDSNGAVTSVDVQRAPDPAIERAIRASLAKWTFRPIDPELRGPVGARTKLVFYFEIRNGVGKVFEPKGLLADRGSPPD